MGGAGFVAYKHMHSQQQTMGNSKGKTGANLRREQLDEDHELQRNHRHRSRLVFDNQDQGPPFSEEDYDIPNEEECRFDGGDTESLVTPHGREKYLFEEPPLMNVNTEDHHLPTDEVQEILNTYGCIKLQRTAIRESLEAFSRELTNRESAELCTCFESLKQIAGIGCKIEIVKGEGEPSHLDPDETAWENLHGYHHAVLHFNCVLSNSSMFLQMKQVAIDTIMAKLASVHQQSGKNQASKQLCETLKEIPEQIKGFADEVERLLHDVEAAKYYLKDKEVTGRRQCKKEPVPQYVHFTAPLVFGREDYLFNEVPKLKIPPKDSLPSEAKEIVQSYDNILQQRITINQSLKTFATSLGRPELAELTACFRVLRTAAGEDVEIKLNHGDTGIQLTIDEMGQCNLARHHGYQDAVRSLNSALRQSSMIMQRKNNTIAEIQTNWQKLYNQGVSSQQRDQLLKTLRTIPTKIEKFAVEAERFLSDVEAAEHYLTSGGLLASGVHRK